MTNKPNPTELIKESLTAWSVKKDVTEFIKERMGLKPEGKNETHAEELIDNIIHKAKYEDEPKWTTVLLAQIKEEKKATVGSTNVFMNAAAVTDETLTKLINVTPVAKVTKIEELI